MVGHHSDSSPVTALSKQHFAFYESVGSEDNVLLDA